MKDCILPVVPFITELFPVKLIVPTVGANEFHPLIVQLPPTLWVKFPLAKENARSKITSPPMLKPVTALVVTLSIVRLPPMDMVPV